ncbi:MAG TPA: hypothetical protein VG755_30835 [Nannocystaceae bacterium]|nr:hypothetical protein [Nannocystaceae bacterium]
MCGDGTVDVDESCDDANLEDDDGCDADCQPSAVIEVSAGGSHTCVLTRTGAVRCWGNGSDGRLGYALFGNVGDNETPASAGNVTVGGLAIATGTGNRHTCAIRELGPMRCWGDGADGRLGYANTNDIGDNEAPNAAGDIDTLDSPTAITLGFAHTCAVLESGGLQCWGLGTNGRLGYSSTSSIGDDERPSDVDVVDIGTDVTAVAAGTAHTCAITVDGDVMCWGLGTDGRLGYANEESVGDDETPASIGVVDVGGAVTQVSAGDRHTCALLDGGTVRCWGYGFQGRLGYGNGLVTVGDDETPATAGDVDVGGTVTQISVGGTHSCALLEGGTVRCWGTYGLGIPDAGLTIGDDETPADVGDVDVGGVVVQISAGANHTCAVLEGGTVRCWGTGAEGRLGYGNTNAVGETDTPASAGDVVVFEP